MTEVPIPPQTTIRCYLQTQNNLKCRHESANTMLMHFVLYVVNLLVRDVKYELKTSHVLCEAYEAYFDCPVRNQDKPWAPHVACSYCKRCLEG
ncbi:uncharacterized protein LOC141527091 isoform X2 [Cotesia typhae]|uniref:uncharacterized protein LOC141527091 isoform X2 n=1 Tax=Cotesia typhae TaxID=2053667 RepID=UPI003D68D1E4